MWEAELWGVFIAVLVATDVASRFFTAIGENKRAIVIPSRPFLKIAIEEDETQKAVRTNWHNAVKATIAEMTKAGEAL